MRGKAAVSGEYASGGQQPEYLIHKCQFHNQSRLQAYAYIHSTSEAHFNLHRAQHSPWSTTATEQRPTAITKPPQVGTKMKKGQTFVALVPAHRNALDVHEGPLHSSLGSRGPVVAPQSTETG